MSRGRPLAVKAFALRSGCRRGERADMAGRNLLGSSAGCDYKVVIKIIVVAHVALPGPPVGSLT